MQLVFFRCRWFDIGSNLAKVPVISSIDIDKDSTETLKQNNIFENTEIILDDLHNVDSKVFEKILLNKAPKSKFIVIGGAPCQPFQKQVIG